MGENTEARICLGGKRSAAGAGYLPHFTDRAAPNPFSDFPTIEGESIRRYETAIIRCVIFGNRDGLDANAPSNARRPYETPAGMDPGV